MMRVPCRSRESLDILGRLGEHGRAQDGGDGAAHGGRSMEETFVPAVDLPDGLGGAAWWFAFRERDLLVMTGDDGAVALPLAADPAEIGLRPVRRQFLGTMDGRACWSAELAADVDPPAGMAFEGLRELHARLHDASYAVAGRAAQIVEWDRTHQFCGRCGAPTDRVPGERAKRCPVCGLTSYPRLSPAVIVLIRRAGDAGPEVLLVRGQGFAEGFYGLVAGFVEPGESLEEAVRREVAEEVGIELTDVRYFGSQPWPYPHALMVGFTAVHAGGELRLDPREVADAAWFTPDRFPNIPSPLSIARRLIDAFVAEHERATTAP